MMIAEDTQQEIQDFPGGSLQEQINGSLNSDTSHELRTQATPQNDIADDEEDDSEVYDEDEEEDGEDVDEEEEEDEEYDDEEDEDEEDDDEEEEE